MYSMATIINNTILHIGMLLRVNFKSSHPQEKKFCNYVWWQMLTRLNCDHFKIYTNIKSLCCTTEMNMFYINYISFFFLRKGDGLLRRREPTVTSENGQCSSLVTTRQRPFGSTLGHDSSPGHSESWKTLGFWNQIVMRSNPTSAFLTHGTWRKLLNLPRLSFLIWKTGLSGSISTGLMRGLVANIYTSLSPEPGHMLSCITIQDQGQTPHVYEPSYKHVHYFFSFWVTPTAYGSSQTMGHIWAAAADHSHSNTESEPHLWSTP